MSSKLVQALNDNAVPGFISDNLLYKDRLLSGIQVRALEHPADFVTEWETYIKNSVSTLYGDNPNLYQSFQRYVDLLAVPEIEVRPLYARFVEKFISEFNNNVVGEDVMGMAVRKLEKRST